MNLTIKILPILLMISCVSNSEHENLTHNEDFKDSSNTNSTTFTDTSNSELTDITIKKDSISPIDTLNNISIDDLTLKLVNVDSLYYYKETLYSGIIKNKYRNIVEETTFENGNKVRYIVYVYMDNEKMLLEERTYYKGYLDYMAYYLDTDPGGEIMTKYKNNHLECYYEGGGRKEYEIEWKNGLEIHKIHHSHWLYHGEPDEDLVEKYKVFRKQPPLALEYSFKNQDKFYSNNKQYYNPGYFRYKSDITLHGYLRQWDENGELIFEEYYENGNFINSKKNGNSHKDQLEELMNQIKAHY